MTRTMTLGFIMKSLNEVESSANKIIIPTFTTKSTNDVQARYLLSVIVILSIANELNWVGIICMMLNERYMFPLYKEKRDRLQPVPLSSSVEFLNQMQYFFHREAQARMV